MRQTVLVVDDEKNILRIIAASLRAEGYQVETARSAEEAISRYAQGNFDLVISDHKLPGMSGTDLLAHIKENDPDMPFLVLTAYGSIEKAVEAMKRGAYSYITKPVNMDSLVLLVKEAAEKRRLLIENRTLRKELSGRYGLENMLGRSAAIREVFSTIGKVSDTSASVMITGESGTGKELAARAIHQLSERRDGPFVPINCATIPIDLLEPELFGYEKGAFTCAYERKTGLLETAHGGTLFFDEIGDLDLYLQKKLLRFYQEREFYRLGGKKPVKVDVRVLAATNRDLEEATRTGAFREDLYYRLNVISVHMPPLRERKEDIHLLANHFLEACNRKFGKNLRGFDFSVIEAFMDYDWPGNVRELENVIERAVVLSPHDMITRSYLPKKLSDLGARELAGPGEGNLNLVEIEKKVILAALDKSSWNQSKTATVLGISRKQLRTKMRNLRITPS